MNASRKPHIRMITPIWGRSYIDRWLTFGFASQRSVGNIPYLKSHCEFELVLLTREADKAYMQSSAFFAQSTADIPIRFISIDELFPGSTETSYGVPLSLAFAKGILDLGCRAIGAYVILMNADCVLASGSLQSVAKRIEEGYGIITAQSIRAIDGSARLQLLGFADESTGILSVPPRELMRIVNRHLHSTVTARILNEPNIVEASYYHQIYWRVSNNCLAMRALMLHPLCFQVQRIMEKVICPVDYGFITEFCPNGRFCAMSDSDDFLFIELQSRDSESHHLRIALPTQSLENRMARLEEEIMSVTAKWTTPEHRRAATVTLLFHDQDLPADLAARLAPFESFVDGFLERLPPAVSHVGHFHWLPAVQIYRENMRRSGAKRVALLDDPRNAVSHLS